MNLKKILFLSLIFILIGIFSLPKDIDAATYINIIKDKTTNSATKFGSNDHHRLYYNYNGKGLDADINVYEGSKLIEPTSTGAQKSGDICHPFSSRKVIKSSGKEAYCVVNEQWFESSGSFTKCSSLNYSKSETMEANLLKNVSSTVKGDSGNETVSGLSGSSFYEVVGEAIKLIDSTLDGQDNRKLYLYKTAVATTALGKSRCRYSSTSNPIAGFLKSAVTSINTRNSNITKFKSFSITKTAQTQTMSKYSNYYMSDAITVKNLMPKLEKDKNSKYVFTSDLENGSVYLCSDSLGKNCTAISSASIDGSELGSNTSKTYYVKVTGATEGVSLSLSMTGTVKYTRNYGTLYCHKGTSSHPDWQPLFVPLEEEKTVSQVKSITLTIPNLTEHKIQIKKVNSNGEAIGGATFKLREQGGNDLDLESKANGTIFEYSFESANEDELNNKTYCIEEVRSPDGYLKPETNDTGNCYPIKQNGSSCYKQSAEGSSATLESDGNYCKFISLTCPDGYDYNSETDIDPDNYRYCKKTVSTDAKMVCEDDSDPIEGKGCLTDATPDSESGLCPGNVSPDGDGHCYVLASKPSCSAESGATLAVDGTCKKEERHPSICRYGNNVEVSDGTSDNYKYCESPTIYSSFEVINGSVYVTLSNEKNTVTISKKIATGGDDEIPGAKLKVCKKADYQSAKDSCTAATTIDGADMEWVSGSSPQVYNGVGKGEYVIIETLPPSGFKTNVETVTEFSIDEDGKVSSGSKVTVGAGDSARDIIVVGNEYNKMSISKTDIATSKELPGATISICRVKGTYEVNNEEDNDDETASSSNPEFNDAEDDDGEDNNDDLGTSAKTNLNSEIETDMYGNCVPAKLADGSLATWVSTDKPHSIEGLPAGTYYLVELTAPKGYSTAEAIKFVMKDDGTLTDADGNSLKDSRIVMQDKPIIEVKTGDILLLIITAFGLVGLGFASYYYFNNKKEIMRKIKRFGKATS